MAYRTRSDTLKLQRLIEVLKERGSDTAASALETAATDFLNDVKPKYKPGDIPFYDGTESDDGSSYVEGEDEDETDLDEEDWDDCAEDIKPHTPPISARLPTPPRITFMPRVPSPPLIREPVVHKEPTPPKEPSQPPTISAVKREPKVESRCYKPAVLLSGVEKSSDIASPLMRFPTLPVSIPNLFGSSGTTTSTSASSKKSNSAAAKEKKRVPEDAVEAVLVDSMTVAAAVVLSNEPTFSHVSAKNNASKAALEAKEPHGEQCPKASTDHLPQSPMQTSSPVRIQKLVRQEEVDFGNNSPESRRLDHPPSLSNVGKSPLRSILKKTPSPSKSTEPIDIQPKQADIHIIPDEPKSVAKEAKIDLKMDIKQAIVLEEASLMQKATIIEQPIVAKVPSPSPPKEVRIEEPKPRSKLSVLLETSDEVTHDSDSEIQSYFEPVYHEEDSRPKPSPKKHVTLQIPEKSHDTHDTHGTLKSPLPVMITHGPGSMRKTQKQVIVPPPQLQYNVPEDAKIPKVGGQRSRKPTLASQWRKQKERQKQIEQEIQDRVDTFSEDWPYSEGDASVPSVTTLAEAGFFFLGLNDCVQCSVCQIVLSGWNAMSDQSDPWSQHVKTSPGCSFLEKTKGSTWINEQLKNKQ